MERGPVGGRDYLRDLAELRAWFPTDATCVDYLDWMRWRSGFVCPLCACDDAWIGGDGRYRCKGCKRHVTVTSGTVFDKTRTPLTVWFEAAWEMVFYRLVERAAAARPVTHRDLVRVGITKTVHPVGPKTHRRPGTLAVEPVDRPWRSSAVVSPDREDRSRSEATPDPGQERTIV